MIDTSRTRHFHFQQNYTLSTLLYMEAHGGRKGLASFGTEPRKSSPEERTNQTPQPLMINSSPHGARTCFVNALVEFLRGALRCAP